MGQPRLCILSTGRAGSGYIARLLTAAGVPCGHEHYYSTGNLHRSPHRAESSWLALPRVESGHFKGRVHHQVRHPLRVISSLLNGQMQANRNRPYAHFQQAHLNLSEHFSPVTGREWLAFTIRFVVEWNRRCEREAQARDGITYRVEEVDEEILTRLATDARANPDPVQIKQAIADIPATVNKHPDGPSLTWSDLPDTLDASHLLVQAGHYGYL